MQKWEYYTAILEKDELAKEWQDEVNSKGEDGWEMVSATVLKNTFYIFFKKPLVKKGDESSARAIPFRMK